MYCTHCGRETQAGARFCSFCGAPVERSSTYTTRSASYDNQKEIAEAVAAGEKALQSLYAAKAELDKARNWGLVDLVGGGLISSLVKRSKMDNAQSFINQAKYDLKRFSDELDDVSGLDRLNINTDDFLNFADWFFDGLVVDFLVQDKIIKARNQVDDAINRVENILRRLK